MKYEQAKEYLEEINKEKGMVFGLDCCRELCRRVGDPQERLAFVHIAGTNGKGSIAAYISTVLQEGGYRTGLYTSPTIRDYRERIRVNGRNITKKAVGEWMERLQKAAGEMVEAGFRQPTVFELETVMAFLHFAKEKCQIVVLETGLGGTEDATNVITHTLAAVFASISRDHMAILGNTLEEIAEKKAGIIKPGCTVVTGIQQPEALQVLRTAAEKKNCPFVLADSRLAANTKYGILKQQFDYKERKKMVISLAGTWQIANCITALEALQVLGKKGFPVSEEKLRAGLLKTRWDGRFTVLQKKPLLIADGAHNEDAAGKLADSIRFYFTNRRIIYIMGVLKDKEYEKIVRETYALAEHIITVTPPENPRALPAYELAKVASMYHTKVTSTDSVEEALEVAELLAGKEDVIIAFGSLSYLGRLMDAVDKRAGVKK